MDFQSCKTCASGASKSPEFPQLLLKHYIYYTRSDAIFDFAKSLKRLGNAVNPRCGSDQNPIPQNRRTGHPHVVTLEFVGVEDLELIPRLNHKRLAFFV
jgi:hypothetical protein